MSEIEKEIVDSAEVKESKNFIEKIWRRAYTILYTPVFLRNPTDIFISDMPRVFC